MSPEKRKDREEVGCTSDSEPKGQIAVGETLPGFATSDNLI